MATTQMKTFKAPTTAVWPAVVRAVSSAGYPIRLSDDAARRLVYSAAGNGWAFGQLVTVSVTSLGEDECLVTVRAEAETQWALTEGGHQDNLIGWLFQQLEARFPLAEQQPTRGTPPGMSGCFGVVLLAAVTFGALGLVVGR